MKRHRRQFLQLAASAAALPMMPGTTSAQGYPRRPITVVVGAAAGGPTDTIGRIITESMRALLGQTIVIENNGAAAGSIAHGRVARAAPDGYTLSLGHWGTHVVNGAVYSLQYDVLKDFEPVALISVSPYFMVGRRDHPANDLKDLIACVSGLVVSLEGEGQRAAMDLVDATLEDYDLSDVATVFRRRFRDLPEPHPALSTMLPDPPDSPAAIPLNVGDPWIEPFACQKQSRSLNSRPTRRSSRTLPP